MTHQQQSHFGKVYLVGAGPGDPRLMTLRGVQCLARADLVLYDCLVDPAILNHAPPSIEAVCVGRYTSEGPRRTMPQEKINALLIDAARQGKTVVYLKGGDPGVFGHSAQQIEALAAAGIPVETVPGVTAAVAAAAYAGIPITHSRHSSAVALVTEQQQRNTSGPPLDYAALAEFPGTLVFYMGLGTGGRWSRSLISRGKSPDTPVAIVRRCSWPDQEVIGCTLCEVADVIARRKLRGPAVIVVGEVVSLAPDVSWFAARPLSGVRVLLTRPPDQAGPLSDRLADLGAEVLLQPAICISDPPDWEPVDAALAQLDRYRWLVFSSANGVRYLLDRLLQIGGDLRRLGGVKLAAIGPQTAEELRRYRLQTDLVPEEYRAEALAEALVERCWGSPTGGTESPQFLLARASRGREVLAQRLRAAGGTVDQIVVYSSADVERADAEVSVALSAGRIGWITVTSSAIARSLVALFGEELRQSKLASISPVTSEVLRRLGHQPAAEATQYTTDGLLEAILAARR